MSDLKQKLLSAMKHISPGDMARHMKPAELSELHHKTKKALALHDEHAAATKEPSRMNSHENHAWTNKLIAAQGKQ